MRVIVPPLGNETIGMLKTTSLVLAVPFTLDLTFATNGIANKLFTPIPLLIVAALWYLAITSVLMVGQHYLERYFGRGFDARTPGAGPPRSFPPGRRQQLRHHPARPAPGGGAVMTQTPENLSRPVIQVEHVEKSFGDLHVLKDCDLTVRAG